MKDKSTKQVLKEIPIFLLSVFMLVVGGALLIDFNWELVAGVSLIYLARITMDSIPASEQNNTKENKQTKT